MSTANIESKHEEDDKDKNKNKSEGPIICPGHTRAVSDLSFSKMTQDGYFLISACLDNKAMLREGATGDWIGTFAGHKGAVWGARLNEDATRAVTASADCTAKVWDAVTGEESASFLHRSLVRAAIFSKDGNQIYTAGMEKKVRLFDLQRPDANPSVFEAGSTIITHLGDCSDPNLVVSAGAEKGVRVWDKRTLKLAKTVQTASEVTSLTVSLDESTITVTAGKDVYFLNYHTFDLIKKHSLSQPVNCAAYYPSTNLFVAGLENDLWVHVYDFETGKEIGVNKGHHGFVRTLAFNPVGDSFASGADDATIRIWDVPAPADKE